jgi:hypothetical protein
MREHKINVLNNVPIENQYFPVFMSIAYNIMNGTIFALHIIKDYLKNFTWCRTDYLIPSSLMID